MTEVTEIAERAIHGPLPVYEAIAGIPSVTFYECRMYSWLRSYWTAVHDRIESTRGSAEGLKLRLVGRGQFLVSWTGRPQDSRRTVLVVHTDREGFEVKSVIESGDSERVSLVAQHCVNTKAIPAGHVGQAIQIDVGPPSGRSRRSLKGTLDRPLDESGRVQISVARSDIQEIFELKEQVLSRRVSAQYAFTSPWSMNSTAIDADCVDNYAGVSVATAVLTKIVLGGDDMLRDVNTAILYTTGEEAGMVGLMSLFDRHEESLLNGTDRTGWIVLDCSYADRARMLGMDRWRRLRFPEGDADLDTDATGFNVLPGLEACDVDSASIRLEDRVSFYDSGMIRFLYQAALNARLQVPLLRESAANAGDQATAELWNSAVPIDRLGKTGMFQGGYCEASVLNLAPEVMKTFHLDVDLERPRCGAIVIPVEHYRFYAPGPAVQERCEAGALLGAFAIAQSAVAMYGGYRFPKAPMVRLRGGTEPSGSLSVDGVTLEQQKAKKWQEDYQFVRGMLQLHELEARRVIGV